MNKTKGELEYITVENNQSSIKVALQGAHILDFQCKGKKPLLFLSETARFEKGFPIRGGIPVCWPWFGSHPSNTNLPNHGFARTSLWSHLDTQEISENKTKISLGLKSSKESLALWPFEFELTLEILISDCLEVSLISKNTGVQSFPLTQALHTYLNIEDIHKVQVQGLENKPFYNKINNSFDNVQESSLDFHTEVDRVYHQLTQALVFEDEEQTLKVETFGSNTVVVWNPGSEFKQIFSDLSSYKKMLCLESANTLEDEVELHQDEVHVLKTIISQY